MDHTCFNPRPPLLAGDARRMGQHNDWRHVSIHARHYWRAMPEEILASMGKAVVSIHARHYWRAMRRTLATTFSTSSFNPRPPLLAGDAPAAE